MGVEQSLSDILKARETRAEYQQYLLDNYRNTVVSYKLNIPGPVKYSPFIRKIFDEGLAVFTKKIGESSIVSLFEKVIYKNSGPEYLAVFDISPYIIKGMAANIEEMHPLGRLYDFDVFAPQGRQISREELGIGLRKCLLCDSNAFECGRSRKHDIRDLISKIENMALEYFDSYDKG